MQECEVVYVTFLDDYSITYGKTTLDESKIKSDKISLLLAYILCHRYNNISVGELTDVLWNDEESDNPVNALKNLIYRTRCILKRFFGQVEFIRTGRGYYSWNKDIPVVIDIQDFERMHEKAENENSCVKRIEYQKKALSYYKKHFLEQYTDCYWVVTLNAYYRTMYTGEVVRISRDLYEQKDYKSVEQICGHALMIDELSEDIHYYYMRALISRNKVRAAEEHYIKMQKMFNERLCTEPSGKLCALNDLISAYIDRSAKGKGVCNVNKNRINISDIFHRSSYGALVCDYDVFVKNCELEKRRMRRNSCDAYTVVFTVESEECADNDGIVKDADNDRTMRCKFLKLLVNSVRESDIVSEYGSKQYILLLPECSLENARDIVGRIMDNCRRNNMTNVPAYQLNRLT